MKPRSHLQLGGVRHFGDGLDDGAHYLGGLGLGQVVEKGPQLREHVLQGGRVLPLHVQVGKLQDGLLLDFDVVGGVGGLPGADLAQGLDGLLGLGGLGQADRVEARLQVVGRHGCGRAGPRRPASSGEAPCWSRGWGGLPPACGRPGGRVRRRGGPGGRRGGGGGGAGRRPGAGAEAGAARATCDGLAQAQGCGVPPASQAAGSWLRAPEPGLTQMSGLAPRCLGHCLLQWTIVTMARTNVTIYHPFISQAGWNRCNLSI